MGSDINTRIGKAMQMFRVQRDITQNELASEMGIKASELSYYEKGKRTPKISTVERFAECMGIKLSSFFSLIESNPEEQITYFFVDKINQTPVVKSADIEI